MAEKNNKIVKRGVIAQRYKYTISEKFTYFVLTLA